MSRRGTPDRYQVTTKTDKGVTYHHVKDLKTGTEMGLLSSDPAPMTQDLAAALYRLAYIFDKKEDELEPRMRIRFRRRKT